MPTRPTAARRDRGFAAPELPYRAARSATSVRPGIAALVAVLAPIAALLTAHAGAAPRQDDAAPEAPRATFSDRIDVVRLTVDVRVVDGLGRPHKDLAAESFRVRLSGEKAEVEAADWIAEAPAAGSAARLRYEPSIPPLLAAPLPPPRRRVYFMQAPWRGSHQIGHLRLRRHLREMVQELPADTLAAVVGFDSHLKLHQDFTADPELLMAALERGRGFHPADWSMLPSAPGPSLARHLDPRQARRAAFPADGLEMVALALAAEPGPSTIVWVGWGLRKVTRPEYTRLVRTLVYTDTPVFILDVTDADAHTEEGGLRQLARDTGGRYFNTRDHPGREVQRVENLLGRGYYRLTVVCPPLQPGGHPLQVRLRGVDGFHRVLAPRHAWIRAPATP